MNKNEIKKDLSRLPTMPLREIEAAWMELVLDREIEAAWMELALDRRFSEGLGNYIKDEMEKATK